MNRIASEAQGAVADPVVRPAELSVLIPSVNSYGDLRGCLHALMRQDAALEIIVIDRLGGEVRVALVRDFPAVILVEAEPGATIPQMRALGHARATAPAVAVIEDHVIVPPDWARRMLDALHEGTGHDAVAGAFENAATHSTVDWAAFLCEYNSVIPPLPSGPVPGLPGNNTIYRRDVLQRFGTAIEANQWEGHLHDAMRAAGVELILRPDIVVGHKMHYTFWLYMAQRFHYSRSYAANRVRGASLPKRLLTGLMAFVLPPILLKRIVDKVRANGRHTDKLRGTLPMMAAFTVSWAAGEIVGYWFGAGDSLARVR